MTMKSDGHDFAGNMQVMLLYNIPNALLCHSGKDVGLANSVRAARASNGSVSYRWYTLKPGGVEMNV